MLLIFGPTGRALTHRLPFGSYNHIEPVCAGKRRFGSQNRDFGGLIMARILLAEDDESMRRFLANALEKAGHSVISYGSGDLAHEKLIGDVFDVLLTDIVMPEMDGIELARRAAELDPTLKIMFITGFAAVALNPESEAPKDARVLSKPFHLRELVQEVDRLLAA